MWGTAGSVECERPGTLSVMRSPVIELDDCAVLVIRVRSAEVPAPGGARKRHVVERIEQSRDGVEWSELTVSGMGASGSGAGSGGHVETWTVQAAHPLAEVEFLRVSYGGACADVVETLAQRP